MLRVEKLEVQLCDLVLDPLLRLALLGRDQRREIRPYGAPDLLEDDTFEVIAEPERVGIPSVEQHQVEDLTIRLQTIEKKIRVRRLDRGERAALRVDLGDRGLERRLRLRVPAERPQRH